MGIQCTVIAKKVVTPDVVDELFAGEGDVFIADLAGKGNRGGIYPSIVNVFVLPDLYE